jgi:hypothetical protein
MPLTWRGRSRLAGALRRSLLVGLALCLLGGLLQLLFRLVDGGLIAGILCLTEITLDGRLVGGVLLAKFDDGLTCR